MNLLEQVLSPTEKKNSKIVETNDKSVLTVLNWIGTLKDINENEPYDKIVRVVFINEEIIKLQSYDNGTPYIFVLGEKAKKGYMLKGLEMLCNQDKLTLTTMEI